MSMMPQPQVIDAALRASFDGRVRFPVSGTEITDKALLSLVRSSGTPGYSTRVDVDGTAVHASVVHFGPRLWLNANWNTDAPTLEGTAFLTAVRRVYGLTRPANDPGLEPAAAPVKSRVDAVPLPSARKEQETTEQPSEPPVRAPTGGGGGHQGSLFL